MTMMQVEMFHPNNSHAYANDEALQWLDQPHLMAKVSWLKDGLVQVGQVKKQLVDLCHQEQLLSHALFAVDMEMDGVQQ